MVVKVQRWSTVLYIITRQSEAIVIGSWSTVHESEVIHSSRDLNSGYMTFKLHPWSSMLCIVTRESRWSSEVAYQYMSEKSGICHTVCIVVSWSWKGIEVS